MKLLFALGLTLCVQNIFGQVRDYNLEIDQKVINIGDKNAKKFVVNGGVPGPLLHFYLGETARIKVKNNLRHPTLIHWHGLILPHEQDGVPYLTSLPIPPGGEKIYEIPITHTGTYWYHSHVMFQEQDGVYGAIKITKKGEKAPYPEESVLLSDFSVERGEKIRRNLKKDGHYYALKKKRVLSWWEALRSGNFGVKFRNSLQRMEGMDYSDVGYDAFLANGKPDLQIFKEIKGQKVKVRLINGSASSIYKVTYGNGPLTIVESDGNPVEKIKVNILPLSIAETYDLLLEVPQDGAVELRATSIDKAGFSSVWLGSGEKKYKAPEAPWIHPLSMTMSDSMEMPQMSFFSELFMNYSNEFRDIPRDIKSKVSKYHEPDLSMGHSHHSARHEDHQMSEGEHKMGGRKDMEETSLEHHAHHAEVEEDHHEVNHEEMGHEDLMHESHPEMEWAHKLNRPEGSPQRIMTLSPKTKRQNLIDAESNYYNELAYGLLQAKEKISLKKSQKLRTYFFTLNGNMHNYVWTINGRALSPESYIKIKKGERVRFVMKNTTMMNHPMHLHGHFFRVMTEQGVWSVLKHTVNVPSMGKVVIEFDASEEKDWLFHCHVLYHMMDGMTRIVRYEGAEKDDKLLKLRKKTMEFNMKNDFFLSSKLLVQSNTSRLEGKLFNSAYMFEYDILADYEKNGEGEIHAARTLTRYLSLYLGYKAEAEKGEVEHSPTLGFTWVLPLNFEVDVKYQPLFEDEKIEVEFENSIQLTDKLQLNLEFGTLRSFFTELEYRQTKNLSFVANYNKKFNTFGLGLGYIY